MTPKRIVAPVNGEVVLLAGVCGEDGYFVKKQPIEWMLSQDSVGSFVEVGDDHVHRLAHLGKDRVKKHSPVYATGYTSTNNRHLTRGTSNPRDDVHLKLGQCWISVTSATEGTSHVTILAPKSNGWEQRRRTATIHWVDAQWELPPPAVVRATRGASHRLRTRVLRNAAGTPAQNWKVRYELVAGPQNVFAGSGQPSIEVTTDPEAVATADLRSVAAEAGVNEIRIEIIRPAQTSNEVPRMVVGRGATSVTWSAPGLTLNAQGPSLASVSAPVSYVLEVANPGDMPATSVEVTTRLPRSLQYSNSTPAAENFGEQLKWSLGDLPPRSKRTIRLNCQTLAESNVRLTFAARSREVTAVSQEVGTEILRPVLQVRFVNPPQRAEVGDKLQFQIEITNSGQAALNDIVLTDVFDRGLRHIDNQTSPIRRVLGALAPGQTNNRLAVSFIAEQPGVLCHQVTVRSADGHVANTPKTCVTVTRAAQPAPPQLDVSTVWQPQRVAIREQALLRIRVTNSGNRRARRVRIMAEYPTTLSPTQASDGFRTARNRNLYWWDVNEDLLPGQETVREIVFRALERGQPRVAITVESNGQAVADNTTSLEVGPGDPGTPTVPFSGAPTPAPGRDPRSTPPRGGPPRPTAGKLSVSVRPEQANVAVGQEVTYFIEVRNQRNQDVDNVRIEIRFPRGTDYVGLSGSQTQISILPDGSGAVIGPIRTLRANDLPLRFRLRLKGSQPGRDLPLEVSVTSRQTPEAVTATSVTNITGG